MIHSLEVYSKAMRLGELGGGGGGGGGTNHCLSTKVIYGSANVFSYKCVKWVDIYVPSKWVYNLYLDPLYLGVRDTLFT